MKLLRYLLSSFMISLFVLLMVYSIIISIRKDQILEFDFSVIEFIQVLENPQLTFAMNVFTTIGSFKIEVLIVIGAILFLSFVLKHRKELILFVFVIVGTPILNHILKQFFHRARPDLHRLIEIGVLSFLLWRHIPSRLGRTLLLIFCSVFIFMIGISRIYLGVHYPSDVIGGYLASAIWLAIAIHFFKKYKRVERRVNFGN
jgi:undecaprenyl-diphosphatase